MRLFWAFLDLLHVAERKVIVDAVAEWWSCSVSAIADAVVCLSILAIRYSPAKRFECCSLVRLAITPWALLCQAACAPFLDRAWFEIPDRAWVVIGHFGLASKVSQIFDVHGMNVKVDARISVDEDENVNEMENECDAGGGE